jgi:hypothetical protein
MMVSRLGQTPWRRQKATRGKRMLWYESSACSSSRMREVVVSSSVEKRSKKRLARARLW